jgi:hypothetical protein
MTAATLYFGMHRGKPLADVPADYLQWTLRNVKLSSGVRGAVVEELRRRGVEVPVAPQPREPSCPGCPAGTGITCAWFLDTLNRRHLKAWCRGCNRALGFVDSTRFAHLAGAKFQNGETHQ